MNCEHLYIHGRGYVNRQSCTYCGEVELTDSELVELFRDLGKKASFHFADDSCGEWGLGNKYKAQALRLFDSNEHLQDEMRKIAQGFLWSMDRPEPMECQWCKEISLRFKGVYVPPNGAREWQCDCGYIAVLPRLSRSQ